MPNVVETPVVFDEAHHEHRPIQAGAVLPSDVIPISEAVGNLVQRNEDGIFVGGASIVSADEGNVLTKGTDGGAKLLVKDILSSDEGNMARLGSDGKVLVPPTDLSRDADNLLGYGSDKAISLTVGDILSNDKDNALHAGSDGKVMLTLPEPAAPPTVVSADEGNMIRPGTSDQGAFLNAEAVLSNDSGNLLSRGEDGKLMLKEADLPAPPEQVKPVSAQEGNLIMPSAQDSGAFLDAGHILSTDEDNILTTGRDGKVKASAPQVVSAEEGNLVRTGLDGGAYMDANDILSNGTSNMLTIDPVDKKISLNQEAVAAATSVIREGDKILFKTNGAIGASLSMNYDQFTGDLTLVGQDGFSVINKVNIPSAPSSLKGVEATQGMPSASGQAVEGDYHLSFVFADDSDKWTPGAGVTIRTTKGQAGQGQFQLRLPSPATDMTQARVFFLGDEKVDTGNNQFNVVFNDGSTASITLTRAGDIINGDVTFTPAIGIEPGLYLHFIWMLATGELGDTYVNITQYIGVYEAGQGIDIQGNVINAKLAPGGGLKMTDAGLALTEGFGISSDPNNELTTGSDDKLFVSRYAAGDGIDISDKTVSVKPKPGGGLGVDGTGAYVDADDMISSDENNALVKGADDKLFVPKSEGMTYEAGNGIDITGKTISVKTKEGGAIVVTADGADVDYNKLVSSESNNGLSVDGTGKLFAKDYDDEISSLSSDVTQAKQAASDAQASVGRLETAIGESDTDYVSVFESALNS